MAETMGAPGSANPGSERQADMELIRRANYRGKLVTSIPKWIALAIIAWQVRLSVDAMAGKNGIASLLVRFGREASYWEVVCWAGGILGVLYGLYSSHLLRRYMAHDASRLNAIERRLNLIPGPNLPESKPSTISARND